MLSPLLFIILTDEPIKEYKMKVILAMVGYMNLMPVRISECVFEDDLVILADIEKYLQHNMTIWKQTMETYMV